MIALVEEHGAKLTAVQPFDERRRKAHPRPQEPVAERERPTVLDDVDPALQAKTQRRRGDARRDAHLARDERADEHGRRGHLAEQGGETQRDAAARENEDQRRDDVGGVLGAAREQVLNARHERQEEGDEDHARDEREPEQERERAISAGHVRPSAPAGAAQRGVSRRPCRARR